MYLHKNVNAAKTSIVFFYSLLVFLVLIRSYLAYIIWNKIILEDHKQTGRLRAAILQTEGELMRDLFFSQVGEGSAEERPP